MTKDENARKPLARAAGDMACIRDGAAHTVIPAVYARTTQKYDERGIRYVHMDAGFAAENFYLQATAVGRSSVVSMRTTVVLPTPLGPRNP